MGFFDRLFGSGDDASRRSAQTPSQAPASGSRDADGRYAPPPAPGAGTAPAASGSEDDRQAIERYRYLLRTAPPETVEQVHAEAFGRLTPAQRQQVLAELSSGLAPSERPSSDDPASLARAATRAEYSQPGFMERTFGGRGFSNGPGFGSMLGASMLGTIGGYVVGSALVSAMFDPGYDAGYADGAASDGPADAGAADPGAMDAGGADFGGDFGGDFGF
ncbi:hypothetical protein [Microbacterium testaceum]|uniref:hypothetical protein n=1 Tax=Microbacterium testaceum TaxID=2033 RepID=UPI0012460AFF|nr:hypothetical protein [Microbacterium testaceum]